MNRREAIIAGMARSNCLLRRYADPALPKLRFSLKEVRKCIKLRRIEC